MYYYLFYKYYRLFEHFKTTRWLTDVKAVIVVISLEIWILFSLNNYWDVLLGRHGELSFFSFKVLVPFLLLMLLKWFAFWKDDRWKEYVNEFNQWSQKTNNQGSWIVACITLLCFANLVFSFYLNPPPGGFRW